MSTHQALSPSPAPQPSPFEQLAQMSAGYMLSSGIYVVSKLNIADLLSHGPRSAAELASSTGVNQDALYRTMRLLAGYGVFQEVGLRYFSLTPLSEMLRTGVEGSMRDCIVWMSSPIHNRVYAHIMHTLKTGEPAFEAATGLPCFEYFTGDQQVFNEFNAGMTAISSVTIPAILEAYDFTGIRKLVDVAGGHGFVLTSILQRYPQMRGVLFDMEPVVNGAKGSLQKLGLADRCETASGDFFQHIPAGGDAYMMQHIVHDWDDERALTILKNVRRALDGVPDGKLLVFEDVVSSGPGSAFTNLLDFEMLLMPGGRERTADEYRDLFSAAGFTLNRIVPTKAPIKVIEGTAI